MTREKLRIGMFGYGCVGQGLHDVLNSSKGFKASGDPYEFPMGAKQLVRQDFVKEKGSLVMHQTSLVFLQKSWIVSFTFLGTSDDEIDELVEKLSFGVGSSPPHPAK